MLISVAHYGSSTSLVYGISPPNPAYGSFGIRSAYDSRMTSPVFQTAIESLDQFTRDFEYPVSETTGFRGKMKVIKDEEIEVEEEEDVDMKGWEFDWKGLDDVLSVVQD
jgi:hypothetical protein